MFDDIVQEKLSPADAKRWLHHVVNEELARIRQDRAIIFSDGGTDHVADWATAEAWRMLASRGPNAEVEDEDRESLTTAGRSTHEISRLDMTLNMLGQDIRSEPRIRRMERSYRELTGCKGRIAAPMLLLLRKYLIEGRAAAWSNVPADQGADIAQQLAARLSSNMLKEEREFFLEPELNDPWDGLKAAAIPLSSPPPAIAMPCPVETAPPAPPADQPRNEPEYDPSVRAVIGRLVAQKKSEGVSSTTLKQYESFAALFTMITGVVDVRSIKKSHASRFRDNLQAMPKSWGKSPKDAQATLSEMRDRARQLPAEKIGLSAGTINRHLDHLSQMLEQASDNGILIDKEVKPTKLRVKEVKRDMDKRSTFRKHELEALFMHTIWKGCKSDSRRNHPGTLVIKDGLYWAPILAAYTGARREELTAITADNVLEENGIIYLQITGNSNRGVKTLASVRRIPLHHRLIELGFLDHVKAVQAKSKDLFPELRPKTHNRDDRSKKYGDRIWYALDQAFEKALDGNPRNLCFHSTRHYVRDQFALNKAIPEKVRLELIGHEGDDVDSKVYGEGSPIEILKAAIDTLPVVI